METTKLFHFFTTLGLTLAFVACSSAPIGIISSSADPNEEISKLSQDLDQAQLADIDVLARDDYKKSSKYLRRAKRDLVENKDQEKIIDDLRFGREALNKAYDVADKRENNVPSLFVARQKAIRAGANRSAELKESLNDIDRDLASIAYQLNDVSTNEVAKFQARYVELEKKSVVQNQLGKANAMIIRADKERASNRAPNTLRKAKISFKNAESLIGSNLSNPSGFQEAVEQANYDANHLAAVMSTIDANGKYLTEASALKMVAQNRRISNLNKNLKNSKHAYNEAEYDLYEKSKNLESKERTLEARNKALGTAQGSVAMQQAMESSRQKFSNGDAEAYQQGEDLLIRLKTMRFKTGSSELPSNSIKLLVKVADVAKSLNAQKVKVVGHTDSVGSRKLNKKLSEQRARAVADYFKATGLNGAEIVSEGRGSEDPVASNETSKGRAQNRRVDVIITPNYRPTVSL